jgi:hypothetical protein
MNQYEAEMLRLLSGYWFAQALYVAASLGIPDRLAGGAKSADILAAETLVDGDALYRLLRGLASAGIFAEVGPRTFALTPLSETLREGRKNSLRPMALVGGNPIHWQAWGRLLDSVRTGESAFVAAHGEPFFAMLERNDELRTAFHHVLSRTTHVDQCVVDALERGAFRRIIDIGGGTGELAVHLAAAHIGAEVELFDRAEVLDGAGALIGVKAVPGDFFAGVPAGADAYVLKFTLHDWNDGDAIRILANCRDAMLPEGRVFVVEVIVPEGPEPSIAKTHDVNMLVLTGGRERTLAEYERLFAAAGLSLLRAIATPSGASVLETASVSAAS